MIDLYIETSVWSHAFADDAPESRQAVLRLLDRIGSGVYRAMISVIVMQEILAADSPI